MSENIVVTIKGQRGVPPALTTIASGVVVQLDNMQIVEATGYSSSEPHNVFDAYTTALPVTDAQLLQGGDVLIDAIIDPLTLTNRKFRIVTIPEPFPDGHIEFVVFRYVGK